MFMPETFFLRLLTATVVGLLPAMAGCRTWAPIYVWRPAQVATTSHARVALAPVVAAPELSAAIESAMLAQRPAARADLAVLTSQQLQQAAPVRLASTIPLTSDLAALEAAKCAGADILLFGQVHSCNIDWSRDSTGVAEQDINDPKKTFLEKLGLQSKKDPGYHILLYWNVLDVRTGKSIGSQHFKLHSCDLALRYPDLNSMAKQPGLQLITGSARESWKAVAPYVVKDEVLLAQPVLQPGSWRVLRGVRAAKQGNWQMAEYHWQKAAAWNWLPTPAAHHNLAIAHAAREDFSSAKQQLQQATGPLSLRLPSETLVWLDDNHRKYHQSHRLDKPAEGWAFPDYVPPTQQLSVHQINENDLPWWSGLPFSPVVNP